MRTASGTSGRRSGHRGYAMFLASLDVRRSNKRAHKQPLTSSSLCSLFAPPPSSLAESPPPPPRSIAATAATEHHRAFARLAPDPITKRTRCPRPKSSRRVRPVATSRGSTTTIPTGEPCRAAWAVSRWVASPISSQPSYESPHRAPTGRRRSSTGARGGRASGTTSTTVPWTTNIGTGVTCGEAREGD